MSLRAEDILNSPDYFPLRFDGPNLVFVRMSRDSYNRSIFTLPNRIVTANDKAWQLPFADIVSLYEQADGKQAPASWIFQIAHCGSTLLSRALDFPGRSLAIRESFALRQFAASPISSEPASRDIRKRGLKVLLQLLGRQYHNDEAVIVKANVPVNFAISEILDLFPMSQGILLHSSFEDYLLAILKAEERQQWAQHVVNELSAKIRTISGFESLVTEQVTGGQAAAILWASQMQCYQSSLASAENLKTLLSDDLYTYSAPVISASAKHLGMTLSDDEAETITSGDLFRHHSKNTEQVYTAQMRAEQLQILSEQHADEMGRVRAWCNEQNIDVSAEFTEQSLQI